MNNDLKITTENQKFLNAFMQVAEIIEPKAVFEDVMYQKHINGHGVSVDYAISGYMNNGTMVQVTKEGNPLKGDQIVVYYINPTNGKTIRTRSVWFFAFNWTGLMETCK